MRMILQRVEGASVVLADSRETVAKIRRGLVCFLGIGKHDHRYYRGRIAFSQETSAVTNDFYSMVFHSIAGKARAKLKFDTVKSGFTRLGSQTLYTFPSNGLKSVYTVDASLIRVKTRYLFHLSCHLLCAGQILITVLGNA